MQARVDVPVRLKASGFQRSLLLPLTIFIFVLWCFVALATAILWPEPSKLRPVLPDDQASTAAFPAHTLPASDRAIHETKEDQAWTNTFCHGSTLRSVYISLPHGRPVPNTQRSGDVWQKAFSLSGVWQQAQPVSANDPTIASQTRLDLIVFMVASYLLPFSSALFISLTFSSPPLQYRPIIHVQILYTLSAQITQVSMSPSPCRLEV